MIQPLYAIKYGEVCGSTWELCTSFNVRAAQWLTIDTYITFIDKILIFRSRSSSTERLVFEIDSCELEIERRYDVAATSISIRRASISNQIFLFFQSRSMHQLHKIVNLLRIRKWNEKSHHKFFTVITVAHSLCVNDFCFSGQLKKKNWRKKNHNSQPYNLQRCTLGMINFRFWYSTPSLL